jgi:formylglycine-generating enzyme required for sulfatase activity
MIAAVIAVILFIDNPAVTNPSSSEIQPKDKPLEEVHRAFESQPSNEPKDKSVSSDDFQPTVENRDATPGDAPEGMVWIPGGEFSMGSIDPRGCLCGGPDAMPDARPIHRVSVDGFWMDKTEVTNDQFAAFVEAT